jgi:photosystem II stability/assembly factor-like uncharacterized protein
MNFKKLCVLLGFCLFSINSFSQKYKEMMYDLNVNFYDVVKEAESYFSTHEKGKGSSWTPYQRWKSENESKYAPDGIRNGISPYFTANAYQEFTTANPVRYNRRDFDNGWEDLGPYSIDNITGHYSPGLGRVESFYVNPSDENRIYLGSRSGGFWRTEDGGTNWKQSTDFLTASGVNAIGVSPTNQDSVYINIRNAGNGTSHGVYHSTDGGKTWKISEFNPTNLGNGGLGTNFQVYMINFSPYDSKIIYVGANNGLYRSTDNLNTWTKVSTLNSRQVKFHPTNPDIVYLYSANARSRVYKSTNGGLSFSSYTTISGASGNGRISVSKDCPNCIYYASNTGVWKSTDTGNSFVFLSNPNNNAGAFEVGDQDTSLMIYGGIDAFASNNGGSSFAQVAWWSLGSTSFNSNSYIHADMRASASINGKFYLATDGYLVRSDDGGNTWTRLSKGTGIRENYSMGLGQSNKNSCIIGSQDNGTSVTNDTGWLEIYGADGMEGIIHPINPDWMIGSWQFGGRRRSLDGGTTGHIVTPPGHGTGAWIAPLINDPNDQMVVLSFSSNIFRSEDFGTSWEMISQPGLGTIDVASIAYNNSKIIFFSDGSRLRKSTDGGYTIEVVTIPTNYSITDITFDPNNDSTVIITHNRYQKDNKKVFISHDLGNTWTNITYNLGDMPIRTAVIDHSDSSYIYLGAEIGVYYKSMKSNSWQLYNENLPNTTVRDLEIHFGSNTLKAATWGRGLWEYTLKGRKDYPSITHVNTSEPITTNSPIEGIPMRIESVISYDGNLSEVYLMWSAGNNSLDQRIDMELIKDSTYKTKTAIPNQPEGTEIFFKVVAIGSNLDSSSTHKYMYRVKPFKYCDASGSPNTGADYIIRVSLNGFENLSNKDSYGDFTDKTITLWADSTYTLMIGMAFSFDLDTTAAWIDFDRNGNFDQDEMIVMGELDANHDSYGTFKVPTYVVEDTVRMRVRSQFYNESPTPCGTRVGEVEDYSIVFKTHTWHLPVVVPESVDIKIHPNPTSGIVEIDFETELEKIKVEVYNVKGQLVSDEEYSHMSKLSTDLRKFDDGLYFIHLKNSDFNATFKVVKSSK